MPVDRIDHPTSRRCRSRCPRACTHRAHTRLGNRAHRSALPSSPRHMRMCRWQRRNPEAIRTRYRRTEGRAGRTARRPRRVRTRTRHLRTCRAGRTRPRMPGRRMLRPSNRPSTCSGHRVGSPHARCSRADMRRQSNRGRASHRCTCTRCVRTCRGLSSRWGTPARRTKGRSRASRMRTCR